MIVSQLMTRNVVTCSAESTLEEATSKMWDHDIGALPVVDADEHVVGMITDRDACMAAYTQGRPLHDLSVKSAMAHEIHTRLPTDRLQDVEAVMRTYKVRRVPIVDQSGHLVGLISLNDLAREAASELRRRNPDVANSELVSTLASICEPRHDSILPFAAE